MSVLETLTEGIKERSLQNEGAALLEKWDKTGLLEGLSHDHQKNSMARLLENQAAQLLKEASSMAGGDVQGFASVAFPLVRRVFGGLIANDLVSVQPMSLPSGLIFFMDFTFNESRMGATAQESLYGGNAVASQITGGVDLTFEFAESGFYSLNNGYASPTGTLSTDNSDTTLGVMITGTVGGTDAGVCDNSTVDFPCTADARHGGIRFPGVQDFFNYALRDAPGLSGSAAAIGFINSSNFSNLNAHDYIAITPRLTSSVVRPLAAVNSAPFVRRLTQPNPTSSYGSNDLPESLMFVTVTTASSVASTLVAASGAMLLASRQANVWDYPIADVFSSGEVGAVMGGFPWGLEGAGSGTGSEAINVGYTNADIPEIDIKVDAVAVTAMTKKLKAKWTPELGQDLNAYHNLDAEVELTQILSEQIALEIDREILNDLVQGATAGKYYWSRSPGLFVNKETGDEIGAGTTAPDFTGNVSEWYETLVETINDISALIHRKTLRGGANFIVCGPEIANVLEFTAGFRAVVTGDADRGTVGAVKVGALSKKWDVYVDPYFLRNVVLVGRKGGSFLESGYVYAPYVPLQVTPTIFGTEDFVPRKGVMTRYAKKMVRPDMYGLVIVANLLGGNP
jgi:hypothetical protein